MYRCFKCDTPAQTNCGCFTQMEHPHDQQVPESLRQKLQDSLKVAKINVSSGEDFAYVYEEST